MVSILQQSCDKVYRGNKKRCRYEVNKRGATELRKKLKLYNFGIPIRYIDVV